MLSRIYKNKKSIFLIVSSLTFTGSVYASCDGFKAEMQAGETPHLAQIICPLIALFNIAILVLAGVFVGFIIYGAIKASMALGDPKGIKGAQQTWTYAVVGAFVVLLGFSIIVIVARIFGYDSIGSLSGMMDSLYDALEGISTKEGLGLLGIGAS